MMLLATKAVQERTTTPGHTRHLFVSHHTHTHVYTAIQLPYSPTLCSPLKVPMLPPVPAPSSLLAWRSASVVMSTTGPRAHDTRSLKHAASRSRRSPSPV